MVFDVAERERVMKGKINDTHVRRGPRALAVGPRRRRGRASYDASGLFHPTRGMRSALGAVWSASRRCRSRLAGATLNNAGEYLVRRLAPTNVYTWHFFFRLVVHCLK